MDVLAGSHVAALADVESKKGIVNMNIEKMTVEELKAKAAECEALKASQRKGERFEIVVLTAGFIYAGWVRRTKTHVHIREAKNVRYWAGNGLGHGALNGPQSGSKIDKCGDLRIPISSIHHEMLAVAEKWA